MNKRPVCIMTVSFVLGISFFFWKEKIVLLLAVILILGITAELLFKGRRKLAFVRSICFLATFFLGNAVALHDANRNACYKDCIKESGQVTCQGEISQIEQKTNQTFVFLKECIFQTTSTIYSCNSIIICVDSNEYPIGKTLVVKGTLTPFAEARNEGNFDEQAYYQALNIDFKVKDATILGVYGKENRVKQGLFEVREHLKQIFLSCMGEKEAGVLTGMLLGDKSLLEKELKSMYQRNGFSHVLCVSGLHISVIGMTVYRFLRKRGISYAFSGMSSGILVVLFAEMSGFGISTKRAVLMFCLMLWANWIGRAYDSLTALAVAAFLLLLENPKLLQHAGFLFSFFAVFGVVGVGQNLIKWIKPGNKKAESILVSLGIQLMTLPLTRLFYYEIPLYGMILNLLLLPMMSVVLYSGILGGVLGSIRLFLGKAGLLPATFILVFYEKVLYLFSKLPHAYVVTGTMEKSSLFFYYGIWFLVLFMIKLWKKRKILPVGIMIAFFVLLKPLPKQERLDVLDVGQGDGIYLCTADKISMFIDGGSSDVSEVGTYRILPFLKNRGIAKISYWFVSHTDSDHISGLCEVIESGYPVENLVFAKNCCKEENYEMLVEKAKAQKISILYLDVGDEMQFQKSRILCLFPENDYEQEEINARSMVLLYETEYFSELFTGDISSEQEQYLLEENRLQEVSFYKAAHHGSKYSNSEEFLEKLSPDISTISCGKNNRYGHPGQEAVLHMKKNSKNLYYTMDCGQITILPEGKSIGTFVHNE